jgi:hypothetical protein
MRGEREKIPYIILSLFYLQSLEVIIHSTLTLSSSLIGAGLKFLLSLSLSSNLPSNSWIVYFIFVSAFLSSYINDLIIAPYVPLQ